MTSARWPDSPFTPAPDVPPYSNLAIEFACPPSEAFAADTELVPFEQATDRIAAEVLAPAPPGVPRLVPGQRITAAHVRFLAAHRAAGGFLLDPADDPEPARVRVMR